MRDDATDLFATAEADEGETEFYDARESELKASMRRLPSATPLHRFISEPVQTALCWARDSKGVPGVAVRSTRAARPRRRARRRGVVTIA